MSRTLRDALRAAEERLAAAGVVENVADARLLLAHAMKASPTWVFAHETEPLADGAAADFEALLVRRLQREPVQHLLGTQEFWRLRLEVTPDVLIPRPETELLVEWALAACQGLATPSVADIGTGSGALVLALAAEMPRARLVATDLSPRALAVARRNAVSLGFEDRIEWLEGDLTDPLRGGPPCDVIVANLPYVARAEWLELEPEVRDFEPVLALVPGERGTELIERLLADAPEVLTAGGRMALEVGHRQGRIVANLFEAERWEGVEARKDLAGIDRVISGRRPEAWP